MVDRAVNDNVVQALQAFAAQRQDPQLGALAAGYRAFKRGDYAAAADQLGALRDAGGEQPRAANAASDFLLPYVAVALSQSGRVPEAQALLQSPRKPGGRSFHQLLAAAYVAGAGARTDEAVQALWEAFLALPPRGAAIIPPGFQLLETCERLYALTHDERYRALLVELARRQQRAWPVSWAYAFEARYATQPDEVERALGIALFLDPQSEHVRDFTAEQRKRAASRFAKNNPFARS